MLKGALGRPGETKGPMTWRRRDRGLHFMPSNRSISGWRGCVPRPFTLQFFRGKNMKGVRSETDMLCEKIAAILISDIHPVAKLAAIAGAVVPGADSGRAIAQACNVHEKSMDPRVREAREAGLLHGPQHEARAPIKRPTDRMQQQIDNLAKMVIDLKRTVEAKHEMNGKGVRR